MTSWAVVCDVYFLEPQAQQPGETAMQFAERVQALVAARAKLVIAPWDGCARAPRPALPWPTVAHPTAGASPQEAAQTLVATTAEMQYPSEHSVAPEC